MANIEDVIESSLEDATLPDEPTPELDSTPEPPVEAVPEPTEAIEAKPEATPEPAKETAPEVPKPVEDDFSKKYGIPAQSITGKENRIPYSRVKKITEKAVNEAKKEWETLNTPKLTEYEGKVKDYETKLERVSRFEQVMVNKPDEFLQMLSTIPAYAQFFRAIEDAFKGAKPTQEQEQPIPTQVEEQMPEPDQLLTDGTKVYSMEGLKALLAWQANQVESKVTKQYEARYKPIEADWQAQQRIQAVIPHVQAQIADARTWPQFNENEEEIVKILQANPKISLEGAYRQVVFPKYQTKLDALGADRNKIREEVLEELKKAPRSTSAPTSAVKSVPTVSDGPRKIEDIIKESIKDLK